MTVLKETTFKDIRVGQFFLEDPVDHWGAKIFLKIRPIELTNGGIVNSLKVKSGTPYRFEKKHLVVRVLW